MPKSYRGVIGCLAHVMSNADERPVAICTYLSYPKHLRYKKLQPRNRIECMECMKIAGVVTLKNYCGQLIIYT